MDKNVLERGWESFVSQSKKLFDSKNAPHMSMLLFYALIIFGEYKVYEAAANILQKDILLAVSFLLVTGISAFVAERGASNPKATKDQIILANIVWVGNIILAVIFGVAAYFMAGHDLNYVITLGEFQFPLVSFSTILIISVSVLTFLEIVIYRIYHDLDIDIKYAHEIEKLGEKRRKDDLDAQKNLLAVEISLKTAGNEVLALERQKIEIKKALEKEYEGKVPPEILEEAFDRIEEAASKQKGFSRSRKVEKPTQFVKPNLLAESKLDREKQPSFAEEPDLLAQNLFLETNSPVIVNPPRANNKV